MVIIVSKSMNFATIGTNFYNKWSNFYVVVALFDCSGIACIPMANAKYVCVENAMCQHNIII